MKRALLVLAMAFGWTSAVSAQSVSARVGGELTGFPGQRITVPIVVDMTAAGGAKLGSYTARVQWDPAVLSYDYNQALGDFPTPQVNTDSTGQGVLVFGGISPTGVSGITTLAGLRFYISQPGGSGTTLDLQFPEMSAAGTFADLLPVTITNGTFCVAKGRWGDLDTDGSSNSRDALAILSKVVGQDVDTELFDVTLGDVDSDTKINSRDALIILSYAVGLSIPGQRVLLPAPSSCGTGSAKQISVFPAAATLVPNQDLQLSARAIDSAGHAVTLQGANWRSSDNTIAGIDANGSVLPRSPGTVTMTALVAPGLSAQATITVVAHRANWYVDVRATGAPVQLGTAALPFEQPSQAFDMVLDGDTIHVASGTYAFDYEGILDVGVVILGGTPRPVFRDFSGYSTTALRLRGGFRTVVKNVVFKNFGTAIDLDGVRNFAMEDVLISATNASYGISGTNDPMDTLRVDRSDLIATDSSGTAIDLCCDRVGLVLIRDSNIKYWNQGASLSEVDSTAVLRSEISANDYYGLEVTQQSVVNPSVYVAHSRIERNYWEGIYVDYARRLVVDTSVIRNTEDDAINVYSDGVPLEVYLHGDSIYHEGAAEDYEWLDASDIDSLVIDKLVVRYPADTNFYAYSDITANYASVTNSKFLNIGSTTEPFAFSGRKIVVNNIVMTGCVVSGCDNGYGLDLSSDGNVLDAEIRNSTFSSLSYPLFAGSSYGAHVATGLVMDSVGYAIQLGGDSNFVANNVLTRVWSSGITPGSSQLTSLVSTVKGNNITCAGGGEGPVGDGIVLVNNRQYRVIADTIESCSRGVVLNVVGSGTRVYGGALRNNVTGVEIGQSDTSTVFVDSVGISGSGTGVHVSSGHAVLTRSRIENNGYGLYVQGGLGTANQAHGNAFTGNTSAAVQVQASDTVDASSNWWGADAPPCVGTGNCANGRIDTTGYLHTAPSVLPGLAPPMVASSARLSRAASGMVTTPTRVAGLREHRAKPAKAKTRITAAPAASASTPARSARMQLQIERRAAAATRRAEREERRAAKHREMSQAQPR